MRTGRLFWGVLFVVVGGLLILDRWNIVTLDWHSAWKFWPLLFVLWGAALLVRNERVKWVIIALTALLVGLLLLGVFSFGWIGGRNSDHGKTWVGDFSEPYESTIQKSTLRLEAAAGRYVIRDTSAQLFEASTESSIAEYKAETQLDGNSARTRIWLEGARVPLWGGRARNRCTLRLNPNPAWDIAVEAGAASADLDLSPFKVEAVAVDGGASSIHLKLGDRSEKTVVTIDAGVSSVRISVPETVGCEAKMEGGLSSKHLDGFEKISSHLYRTEGFDEAGKKILLNIDAAVSSIRVRRY